MALQWAMRDGPSATPGATANTASADPVAVRALADELVPLFYDELRRIARRVRAKVGGGATLQTTALVHETYFKLRSARGWSDDLHFLNAAALAMRHVLVNHATAGVTAKRGSGARHLSLTAAEQMGTDDEEMVVNLNEALVRLAEQSPRLAQIVECRYFGGYSEEVTARALQISERTVRRDWALARAWLHRELQVSDAPAAPSS
jgi:RNA polymerase sigma factor (TIGR02999 family)